MSGAHLIMMAGGGAAGVINPSLPNGSSSIGVGGWELQNDGGYIVSNGAGSSTGDWVTPSDAIVAALYQVKVDVTAGAFTSGTTGTYLDLSSNQSWSIVGAGSATFTVSIREKASQTVRSVQAGKTLTVT